MPCVLLTGLNADQSNLREGEVIPARGSRLPLVVARAAHAAFVVGSR